MASTLKSPSKAALISRNGKFLNALLKSIENGRLRVTELSEEYGVDKLLFSHACKLGYFEKENTTKNNNKYKPNVGKFYFEDIYKITEAVKKARRKYQQHKSYQLRVAKESEIAKDKLEKQEAMAQEKKDEAEKFLKETINRKPIPDLPPIKFTHLQSETDEALIAELKRRGYQGSIEIKKQVTL